VTPPVKRLPGQHHGDLRNALLVAALELVAEHGPRGFSVAEAARRAGVSSAAPYKHFTDRDALLAALAVQGYAEQERRFTAVLADATYARPTAASARVLAQLVAETARVAGDDAEAHELLLTVAALAHGHAVFLLERAFGPVEQALPQTLVRVEAAVRALLAGRPRRVRARQR
jgi:AcrR family transcriptional regulator